MRIELDREAIKKASKLAAQSYRENVLPYMSDSRLAVLESIIEKAIIECGLEGGDYVDVPFLD